MGFMIRLVVTAVALWISTLLVDGIEVTGSGKLENALTLIAVALIFGVINAVLKPIIQIAGCLIYLVTLGLIALVVNALLYLLTGWFADKLDLPFHIDGFWSAFWGAIVVTVVSWLITLATSGRSLSNG